MSNYARIQDGLVAEIIEPLARERPAAPPPLQDGEESTPDRDALQAAHDSFEPGDYPIEERFPAEFVATLVQVPDGVTVRHGDTYSDGVFGPPPPPPAVTEAQAASQRDYLLTQAGLRIGPLQDAVDIDDASPAEISLLKKWKQYRVALNRLPEQAGWPADVQWPEMPA